MKIVILMEVKIVILMEVKIVILMEVKIVILMKCSFVKMGKFAKLILANKITGGGVNLFPKSISEGYAIGGGGGEESVVVEEMGHSFLLGFKSP